MPFVGEVVPLSLQLFDGLASKYVRAYVVDELGAVQPGSPFSLPHVGNGKYSSNALLMPLGVDYLEVTYKVFQDALFTVEDTGYTTGTDVYRLEIPDQVIVDLLNQILLKLDGLSLPGASINAQLVQQVVDSVVKDVNQAKSLLGADDVTISIAQSNDKALPVSENEIATTKC